MWNTNKNDWRCTCGENNFKKRDRCRKCNKSRHPETSKAVWGTNKDDWSCSCGELNFAKRITC